MTTDDEIRQIMTDYEADLAVALERRDRRFRNAIDSGRKQKDIIELTGMSRETVRQAVDPSAREAARRARLERGARTAPAWFRGFGHQVDDAWSETDDFDRPQWTCVCGERLNLTATGRPVSSCGTGPCGLAGKRNDDA